MSNILISPPPTTLLTGLLQLSGGVAMSSTPVYVTDQNNTASSLSISTSNIGINTTSPTAKLQINESANNNFLKLVNSADGTQYFSAYLGSAPNLWDIGPVADDNNTLLRFYRNNYIVGRVGGTETFRFVAGKLGINLAGATPTTTLQLKGSGSTSATTSLLVQNSAGNNSISTTDDGKTLLTATITNDAPLQVNNAYGWTGSYTAKCQSWLSAGSEVARIMANGSMILSANITASTFKATQNIPSDVSFGGNGSGNGMYMPAGNVTAIATNSTERMRIDASGNMGIGTTTPFRLLDVNGDASINTVRVGLGAGNVSSNTVLGTSALNANTTGSNNAGMGIFALAGNLTGSNNTAIGSNALRNNTNSDNTAVGYRALLTNTSGSQNTSVGTQSSYSNLTGVNNVSVGNNTLFTNSTGSGNTAIGASALFNQTGSSLTAVGYEALFTNVSGTRNTAIGNQALRSNTASNNTALGNQALYSNTTGGTNTAIGDTALRSNTNGEQNTALGYTALYTNVSGTENVGLGYQALFNSEASRNVAIGANALLANTTGERNTAVGYSTSSGNFSNSVILGYGATATGSNQFVVGSVASNAGSVVVGANVSSQYWNVKINGVDYKILLA
jgi:hypothetical protein